jgi:alanine racemase
VPRGTFARVYPQALRHNLERVREEVHGARILCCIKADGYGHGATTVAGALADHCDGFAVATLEEALTLRDAGFDGTLLLLEGVHEAGDWQLAAQRTLTVCVSDSVQLDWLETAPPDRAVACWLKVDTGMHRLGIAPDALPAALARLRAQPMVNGDPVFITHFASADAEPPQEAQAQLARFLSATADCGCRRSSANSAAILGLPESHLDWVRPGYMLYGGSPFAGRSARDCRLAAAMSFHSRVIALRDIAAGETVGYAGRWRASRPARIATIAAGYGDGYPRHAPDGTPVAINGVRAPLAGRVSMDMITVDVTDVPGVSVGADVELWGEQVAVDEVAARAGTIGYQLLAGMPARVPRLTAGDTPCG